jgi:adenine deaminase
MEGGEVLADPKRDLLKIAVVERHRGTGNVGLGLVQGFGLKEGALASTVAHDSHHIVVVGTNDEDMKAAVAELAAMGGGQVVVKRGKILAALPLPIAGLMSDRPLLKCISFPKSSRKPRNPWAQSFLIPLCRFPFWLCR